MDTEEVEEVEELIERFDRWTEEHPPNGSISRNERMAQFAVELRNALAQTIGEGEAFAIQEFRGANGEGYIIQGRRDSPGYRYVWVEVGEPYDYGEWRLTEQGAIDAAWEDWNTNGQGYNWAPWSKKLSIAAGFKRKI